MSIDNSIVTIQNRAAAYMVHEDVLEGRPHLVVPVTILVEGVHQGIGAPPIYYSREFLERTAPAWNGVPVPVYHPEDVAGGVSFETCNDPSVINRQVVGRLLNVRYTAGQIKGEIWFDADRVQDLAPDIHERILNGDPIEISTGGFITAVGDGGTWNGEAYDASVQEMRPDHLAVLPDQRGACSVADGCGIRNREGGMEKDLEFWKMIANQMSLTETHEKVARALDRMDNMDKLHYLEDLFDTHVIYRVSQRSAGGDSRFFKADYTINEDDETVEFGEPVEVRKEVDYVVVNLAGYQCNDNPNVGGKKMEKTDNGPIGELIANEDTDWSEDDREKLGKIEKPMLERIVKNSAAPVPDPPPAKKEDGNAEPAKPVEKLPELLANASPELRDFVVSGMAVNAAHRAKLVEGITGVEGSKFTAEVLNGMTTQNLEGIASLIPVANTEGDGGNGTGLYLGAQGSAVPAGEDPAPLPATSMEDIAGVGDGK